MEPPDATTCMSFDELDNGDDANYEVIDHLGTRSGVPEQVLG
jgi:hypothetical protein